VKRLLTALGSLMIVLVLALAAPASATHTNLDDPNDVAGLMDLEHVVFRHDAGPYRWVFKTYPAWTIRQIWDRGTFVIQLDTIGDEAIDFFVVLRSDGRSMVADLFRKRANGTELHVRSLDAARAGGHGATVEVRRTHLRYGAHRTSFFWRTITTYVSPKCSSTCLDLAPDDGSMIEQELPPPTP
jgi:hypothetical protein